MNISDENETKQTEQAEITEHTEQTELTGQKIDFVECIKQKKMELENRVKSTGKNNAFVKIQEHNEKVLESLKRQDGQYSKKDLIIV